MTIVTVAGDRTAPQPVGTTVTWTATPTGGVAPVQYKWWVFDGSWKDQGNWTGSNIFRWTPTHANSSYQVGVWARSSGGSGPEAFAAAPFAISEARVTTVTLAADRGLGRL